MSGNWNSVLQDVRGKGVMAKQIAPVLLHAVGTCPCYKLRSFSIIIRHWKVFCSMVTGGRNREIPETLKSRFGGRPEVIRKVPHRRVFF